MIKTLGAAVAALLLSTLAAVATPLDTVTVTGTWNSGTKDNAGFFGTAGSDLGGKAYTVTYSFDPTALTLASSASCNTDCLYNIGTNGLTETLSALNGSTLVTKTAAVSNGSILFCSSASGCGSIRFDITGVNSNGVTIGDLHLFSSGEQLYTATNLATDPTFLNVTNAGGSLQDINTFQGDTISGFQHVSVSFANVAVPEPLTLSIFGAGLVGAGVLRRRKLKKA